MHFNESLTEAVWRRKDYLEYLHEQPRTKHELMEHIGCSQQNIYKRIGELKDLGLIEQIENQYKLTLYGELALHRYWNLTRTEDYADLLTTQTIEGELDQAVLDDAEFVPSETPTAKNPHQRINTELRNSDYLHGVSCTQFMPTRVNAYIEAMQEDGLDIDAVISSQVMDYITSEYSDAVLSALESGKLTARVTNEEIHSSLMVFDRERIIVIVFESDTQAKEVTSMKGIIINDSTDAVDWALKQFEEYKENSERITLGDLKKKETKY